MPLVLIGVNHKTCPLEIREKFFLQPTEKELLLAEFKNDPRVLAAIILSTCNRTEIYADLLDLDASIILKLVLTFKGLAQSPDLEHFLYVRHEKDVVAHFFSVVAGLDSMILGEKQILGQVKTAVSLSQERQILNRTLNILSNFAIETGKKVRRDTLIDCGGSSVSWAAVAKAQEILGSLEDKTVLVLGSGKMGSLAIQQLKNKGVKKIFVMNRTHEKAETLADECGAQAVPFWQIRDILEQSDVCICSTGAPHYLVDKDLIEQVMAARPARRLAAIDIAVPRNIDPLVAEVAGVKLVAVDDLAQTVQDSMNKRHTAVEQAEKIINLKMHEFYRALDKAAMYELMKESGVSKGACA